MAYFTGRRRQKGMVTAKTWPSISEIGTVKMRRGAGD